MYDSIIVTMGQQMIKEKGGLLAFIRWFELSFEVETSYWMHKSRNKPQHDVLYVYVVICGRIYYRCMYGGHYLPGSGATGQLAPGAEETHVTFPFIILSGPLVKAPGKIERKGFQGFRYSSKIF
jgi:hypothetical protein